MNSKMKLAKYMVIAFLLIVGFQNCDSGEGTETSDPSFQLQLSDFDKTSLMDYFVPKAFADVSSVSMCIHQIRFKADNNATTPGTNANIAGGFITWNSGGTDLGEISVAPGTYSSIDIMIKDECGENLSVAIQNDNGTFTGDQPKILRFLGTVEITSETKTLTLSVGHFINFFDSVTSDAQLAAGVETIDGAF